MRGRLRPTSPLKAARKARARHGPQVIRSVSGFPGVSWRGSRLSAGGFRPQAVRAFSIQNARRSAIRSELRWRRHARMAVPNSGFAVPRATPLERGPSWKGFEVVSSRGSIATCFDLGSSWNVSRGVGSKVKGARRHARTAPKSWAMEPANNAMHLTVRPVTRPAREAPHPTPPSGRAQGARPSRPAGDAQR